MKNSLRFLALAALVAMPFVGRAQTTYTSSDTSGAATLLLANSAVQTFSSFSNLSNVTWTVTNLSGSNQTATFNAYIAQWDTNTNMVVGSLTQFGTTSNVLVAGSGSGSLSFNDTWGTVNPAQTYALILTSTTGGAFFNAATGTTPIDSNLTFFSTGGSGVIGTTQFAQGGAGGFGSYLSSNATAINGTSAYQMSVTGSLAPVPEPKTAAAGIAALFVAALVGRRVMLRRKLAATPLAA
jgi:hypothetical protein